MKINEFVSSLSQIEVSNRSTRKWHRDHLIWNKQIGNIAKSRIYNINAPKKHNIYNYL